MRLSTINLVAYVVLVIYCYLSVKLPLFGRSPVDVSDMFPTLFTPPDFFFRIWMLVYIELGIFTIGAYRQEKKNNGKQSKEVEYIGYLFLISSILNIAWLITWQLLYIPVSFLIVFALWLVLMRLYYKVSLVENAHWIYTFSMSLYFGWVCISTLSCLNLTMIHLGAPYFGLGDETCAAMFIGYGILGTLWMLYLHKDITYTFVICWAFLGMYLKSRALFPDIMNKVAIMALIAMCILLGVSLVIGVKRYRQSTVGD